MADMEEGDGAPAADPAPDGAPDDGAEAGLTDEAPPEAKPATPDLDADAGVAAKDAVLADAAAASSANADGEKTVKRGGASLLRRTSRSIMDSIQRRKSQTIESMNAHDDAEEKQMQEEMKWKMPADFFYDADAPDMQKPVQDNQLPLDIATPARFLGFDFQRHYNLLWTSPEEFCYVTGHVIIIVNVQTTLRRTIHGRDSGGIGCVAMSPDYQYMAVAEKTTDPAYPPNVYIYRYDGLKLFRILRKGTERGYASCKFSPHNKSHLAALGSSPDYLLSIYDWRNERLLLKCKAYGQDVYNVVWGNFPGQLTTCGTGHIRFWKMATTFTGLKLQGDIGKFGATELSDVVGFVELPDGKVITGSEYGKLLLWEGVFVKVELMRNNPEQLGQGMFPHNGAIDVCMMDHQTGCLVSGGDDGFLRWWPLDEIDEAEPDYDAGILEYIINMKKEMRVPPLDNDAGISNPAKIQHVARSADDSSWLIQDVRNGVVWRLDRKTNQCNVLVSTHAKAVTSVQVMQAYPGLVVSSSMDGSLRAFNMTAERENELFVDQGRGDAGIVCMAMAPESVDVERRTVTCGYEDGVVRTFFVCKDGFALVNACKPHNVPILQLAYSADGSLLAVLGANNCIFFLEVRDRENHAAPLGFVQIHCQVNHMAWNDHESGHILLALEDGTIVELMRPISEMVDNTETYLIQLDYRAVLPELPEVVEEEEEEEDEEGEEGEAGADGDDSTKKKKKDKEEEKKDKDEDEEEEEKPKDVISGVKRVVYLSDESVLFVGSGRYLGALWEVPLSSAPVIQHTLETLGEHTSTQALCVQHTKLPNVEVTHLSLSPSERFLFIGFADGHVWVISLQTMQFFADIGLGDSTNGAVPAIAADGDEQMLVVGGTDGGLYGLNLNSEALIEVAKLKQENLEMENSAPDIVEAIEASAQSIQAADPDDWDIPDVESPGLVGIPKDITDPDTYSIQDAKMKSEEENAKAAAERQKRRVRDRISEVRRELEEVQAKNQNIPYGQLSTVELTIDPDYVSHLNREMENKVEEVKHELAWSCEYHERGVQKLREYFLGRLDFERIEVLAFGSPHRVSTFRCPSMSQELQANLARLHELIFAADRESDDEDGGVMESSPGGGSRRAGESGLMGSSLKGSPQRGGGDTTEDGFGVGESGSQEKVMSGAELREMRRQQRQQRKQQMADLEKAKPSDSYEDPQDVEAIAHAEATLGNYMLKTSDSYQVPENQRMNAEKKRRQMFLLEESMHAIKTEFNHRVLALRDFRQQVRAEVQRDLAALKDIDQQLGTETPWAVGLLDDMPGAPPEFPERRFDHSEADMKAFGIELKIRRGEKVEEEQEEEPAPEEDEDEDEAEYESGEEMEDEEEEDEDGEGAGGDGATIQLRRGEGGNKVRGEEDGSPTSPKRGRGKRRGSASKGAAQSNMPISGRSALAARRIERLTLRAQLLQGQGDAAGPLGKAVAKEAQARLWHDKMQLEEHVRQVIDTFDGAVASIEKEKAKLESDLKNADMKLLVLYEELLTLNELEEKDEELLRKATKCRQDKTSIMHQIKECQDLLGEKKAEIEQWQNEETNLQAEFTELVGENSPFLGALLKIYKKKVKRSKRKKGMGDEEDFDEDEDEEEEDSDLESDEDDDVDEDDVGPPQGCDVQIYESVIDLREKRLDMEDALQEIQRAVDELKKTHTRLLGDERRIDKEQKQTDAEIQQFQTDKQRKLNQVQIVFALRLSQVQCLESSADMPPGAERLPPELNEHVVFTHEGLNRLMARITELHQEIREVKANFRQLRLDFRLRIKEKNQAMQHIEDLEAKFQDIQMLKFGQTVDLDLIERSAPNKYVQELQEKVLEAERDHRQKLAEWEKKIEKQKKELAKVTCDNTSLMEQIVSMGYSQMQLDAALNARIANVTVNDTEPLVELREMERERLKDLLNLQTKEIQTLQAEINLFRKKGGHIYTTVTANRMPNAG